MKAHVQNPWTRSPSLMVNVSVEHASNLLTLLATVTADPAMFAQLTANEKAAASELLGILGHAFQTDRPNGVKGCLP